MGRSEVQVRTRRLFSFSMRPSGVSSFEGGLVWFLFFYLVPERKMRSFFLVIEPCSLLHVHPPGCMAMTQPGPDEEKREGAEKG